jgi:NAD(P)-dependent dehydrogenase (short-subunit alcohol dehydrogenase family)
MNGVHKDRVILITGAGGGVGRGYALLCVSSDTSLRAPRRKF